MKQSEIRIEKKDDFLFVVLENLLENFLTHSVTMHEAGKEWK